MSRRIVIATAFAAATLCASGAYAGSPYYDANGQMITKPVIDDHGGLAKSGIESSGQAVGTDGSSVASDESGSAPGVQPTSGVAMPKMDADGFQHREADSNFYEHAVGSDGAP